VIAEGQGARILRDRWAAGVAAADRAGAGGPPPDAARRLVSVYDGGAMPTAPDHWFLGRPVDLDGAEIEGGATGSPAIDAGGSIPFVALHHAPSVGDLLVVTSVGGRWVAERGGAAGVDICVTACGSLPVPGASVTLQAEAGGPVLYSGSTGASGCLSLPASGSYYLTIAISGTVAYQYQHTLPASGTATFSVGSSGLVCCGGYAIPQALTLTDAAGSISFVYDAGSSPPTWFGGHAVQQLSSTITTPDGICTAAPPSPGPVRVCYQMTCNSGQDPTFTVFRSWSWVYQQSPNPPIWFQDPTGFIPGGYCITAPPPSCGNPLTDTAAFGANPAPGGPFALSGTPAPAPSNATGDPVGGSVAISA
jgi:hypothetical protein